MTDAGASLSFRPLTPANWADYETIFDARGCGMARNCACMFYRRAGAPPAVEPGRTRGQLARAEFKALVDAGTFTGILAYRGGRPVGWLSYGPRADFARLQRSPVMKAVDALPVWSVICFVVPPPERGRGVATALLGAAIAHARAAGAVLEAYPVDRPARSSDDQMWFGAKALYDAAGFVEVARRKPERPVVRLRAGQA